MSDNISATGNAKWFVVHTYSGYENKVASNIKTIVENRQMQDQILEVKIPVETVKEIRTKKLGKRKKAKDPDELDDIFDDLDEEEEEKNVEKVEVEVERKLFPGYVMIKVACVYKTKEGSDVEELTMTDDAWYVIRNTRGVTGFVGPESKPVPLSDSEVIALGVEQRRVEVNFKEGDLVNIIDGSLSGFSGIVSSIDLENETVEVLISMFGRETPAQVNLSEVEPVEI